MRRMKSSGRRLSADDGRSTAGADAPVKFDKACIGLDRAEELFYDPLGLWGVDGG